MNRAQSCRWRSLLFVPGNNARLLEGALRRNADALIIDLEDSVAPSDKPKARGDLGGWLEAWGSSPSDALVRVNADTDLQADLDVAVRSDLAALVVPKVESAKTLLDLDELIAVRERERGFQHRTMRVIPIIETAAALFKLDEIASSPRVAALAFGSEDFALSLGVPPTSASLNLPCQLVALAAAANDIPAYGTPASIADFHDLDAFRRAAGHARSIGMHGGLCIHPAQVAVLNDAFSYSAEELQWARAVVEAWCQSGNSGVAVLDGKMIDRPVIERARTILAANSSTETRS